MSKETEHATEVMLREFGYDARTDMSDAPNEQHPYLMPDVVPAEDAQDCGDYDFL